MNTRLSAPKVISVTSGKGGVGKTHTTVNLGLALVKQGKKVLLLDADLGLANINVVLGFQPGATIQQVITGEESLESIVVSHPSGFDVIPAGSGIAELTRLTEDERRFLLEGIDQIARDYDYLLIDTAAGIGDNVMYFNSAASDIVVVVNNEPTSITDAYALIKVLASNHGLKDFHILANRIQLGKDGRNTYAQLAQATDKFLSVGLSYLGSVAEDDSVVNAVRSQQPFLSLFPGARASQDILQIAKKITENWNHKAPEGGLQFMFERMLENS